MSQIITCNAHAQSNANSEFPRTSPWNAPPNEWEQDDPTSSPLTTPGHPDPTDNEEDEINHEHPPQEPNGAHADPSGEPNLPNGGSNGNDGDEQDRDREDTDKPIGLCGEPSNVMVQDFLHLLSPMVMECQDPPPTMAPNAQWLKVNVPDKFNSHKELKSFLVSCNNTFHADLDTFCLHDKCVSYALSYLHEFTQCHFDTQLEDEDEVEFIPPDWLYNWPHFIEELHKMFGDPNVEATVEMELNGLHMWTNQKFADFLVDFNTLSSQVNLGDHALCHWLKQALPNHIKDSLVLVGEPAAFNEWKHLVQNIDQWYWEWQVV